MCVALCAFPHKKAYNLSLGGTLLRNEHNPSRSLVSHLDTQAWTIFRANILAFLLDRITDNEICAPDSRLISVTSMPATVELSQSENLENYRKSSSVAIRSQSLGTSLEEHS